MLCLFGLGRAALLSRRVRLQRFGCQHGLLQGSSRCDPLDSEYQRLYVQRPLCNLTRVFTNTMLGSIDYIFSSSFEEQSVKMSWTVWPNKIAASIVARAESQTNRLILFKCDRKDYVRKVGTSLISGWNMYLVPGTAVYLVYLFVPPDEYLSRIYSEFGGWNMHALGHGPRSTRPRGAAYCPWVWFHFVWPSLPFGDLATIHKKTNQTCTHTYNAYQV